MRTISLTWITFGVMAIVGSASAQPVSDSDRIWIEPAIKTVSSNADHQKFTVAVMIENSTGIAALALPFVYAGHPGLRIDKSVTTPVVIGDVTYNMAGVTYGPAGGQSDYYIRTSLVDSAHQTILLGFIRFQRPGAAPTRDTLCYIHFELDGGGESADVVLDTTALPPSNHLALTDIYANDYIPGWTPGVIRIAPPSVGDLNGSGTITSTDIILLVNWVMISGPSPSAVLLGDADCDSAVSLRDIVWLVNFVFKSGPGPVSDCGH